ncbi:MAG: hypothetical protein WCT31_03475 [Candidatus Micrarchaeia archaeon]|jgi:hypothetical protein
MNDLDERFSRIMQLLSNETNPELARREIVNILNILLKKYTIGEVVEKAVEFGKPAFPALIIFAESSKINALALEIISEVTKRTCIPEAIPLLKSALAIEHGNWAGIYAINALGNMKTNDEKIIMEIAGALGIYFDSDVDAHTGEEIGFGKEVRNAAKKALIGIGKPSVPALIDIVENGNSAARADAMKLLETIGTTEQIPEALPALFGARTRNEFRSDYAESAIESISHRCGLEFIEMLFTENLSYGIQIGLKELAKKQNDFLNGLRGRLTERQIDGLKCGFAESYVEVAKAIRNGRKNAQLEDCELTRMATRLMEQRKRNGMPRVFRQIKQAAA